MKGYKIGTECPACSDKRYYDTNSPQVHICAKCNAVYGTCYKGDSYQWVLPRWGEDTGNNRYYDLEILGSQGIERIHGWVNENKEIVQVG